MNNHLFRYIWIVAAIAINGCNDPVKKTPGMIRASDSVLIAEDTLIIGNGIGDLYPLDDHMALISCNETGLFLLNYQTGKFQRQFLIPSLNWDSILRNVALPSYRIPGLKIIETSAEAMIDGYSVNIADSSIEVIYLPRVVYADQTDTAVRRELFCLKYDRQGRFRSYKYISRNGVGRKYFPGFNYAFKQVKDTFYVFNSSLVEDESMYEQEPLLLKFSSKGHIIEFNGIGTKHLYPKGFSFDYMVKFVSSGGREYVSDEKKLINIYDPEEVHFLFDSFSRMYIEGVYPDGGDQVVAILAEDLGDDHRLNYAVRYDMKERKILKREQLPFSYNGKFYYKNKIYVCTRNNNEDWYKMYTYLF
jgi:hypothetical protein